MFLEKLRLQLDIKKKKKELILFSCLNSNILSSLKELCDKHENNSHNKYNPHEDNFVCGSLMGRIIFILHHQSK